jgi:creatinine amidohydrolase
MAQARNPRRLAELTWPDVERALGHNTGVILPVGSIEQHGPHLPLATDALIAERLADAVAEAADLLVAPPITYAYRSRPLTGGGSGFPGTTSLSAETFMGLVKDILSEFLRQGFKRIAVVSWHFENQGFLYEAGELAHREAPDGSRLLVFERARDELTPATMSAVFGDRFRGWDVEHGGIYESSIMLYLFEHLVLADKIADDRAKRRVWYEIFPTPWDVVAQSGVLTKATESSAEKGELLWSEIVAGLTAALAEDLPKAAPRSTPEGPA